MPAPLSRTAREALAHHPIRTTLNGTQYEWAGRTLQRLLGTRERYAEYWPFFSGLQRPAAIASPRVSKRLTLHDAVTRMPALLGPNGADPENGGQKYFFVKFLDPSDFPTFAYVGFRPDAPAVARRSPGQLRAWFADLLWQDRQLVEALAARVRPRVRTRTGFERLKEAYKRWAIAETASDWAGGASRRPVAALAADDDRAAVERLLSTQQRLRRTLTSLLHRIDYRDGQAILIETPTLHAIAGLSLQIHPRAAGNFFPKDELWIYKDVRLPGGGRGWILVEPQRTFDKTESGADFFTPFAWDQRRHTVGFRKAITRQYLAEFVTLMDATPRPRAHYARMATPVTPRATTTRGRAQWYRVVEEPGWPYFIVRELRFGGSGEATSPLAHHSFAELHATRGTIQVMLSAPDRPACRFSLSPSAPALLPATLPYDSITYRAATPASLFFFTRPTP